MSVVADGRRLFPKGSVAAATLQQPTSFEGAGGRALQYYSTTCQADLTTIDLLSHAPSLIIKIITDRNIPPSQLTAPNPASAS